MKTWKFLGMALFAVFMCVNFVSCSSDDEDLAGDNELPSENESNQKLVTSINSDGRTFKFVYNNKNQLIFVNEVGKNNKIDFEWSNTQIKATPTNNYETTPVVYKLKNGVITSVEGNDISYDNDSHIVSVDKNNWTWSNGNISKFVHKNDVETDTYTFTYYTDKENKHPVVDINAARLYYAGTLEYDELLFIAHPSLLGKGNKNLIKTRTYDGDTEEYTYELDGEGYPLKIKVDGDVEYIVTWN